MTKGFPTACRTFCLLWPSLYRQSHIHRNQYPSPNPTMPIRDGDPKMALASQAACPLFEKLPPEIRNKIYECVFTSQASTRRNLFTAVRKRPWSNLLLTCQRIFAEANGIYELARTSYWRENTFYFDILRNNTFSRTSAQRIVDNLHDRELGLIQEIIVLCKFRRARAKWRLTSRSDNMHGWILTCPVARNKKTHTLVGKRSGLCKMIHVLS